MQYTIANGPMPTIGANQKVATGTAIKTMLQVQPGATIPMKIKEWGWFFDGFAAAQPGNVELIETDVAATVTAMVASGIHKSDALALLAGDPTIALFQVGVNGTGYTATAEGVITAVRNLGGPQLGAPTNQFVQQFPLGDEPIVQPGKFMRIRVLFGITVNLICYVKVEV